MNAPDILLSSETPTAVADVARQDWPEWWRAA
jgi:hypothetical protein